MSSSFTTMASTACASSWRRSRASLCRRPTAASTARSWSISIPTQAAGQGLTPNDVVNAVNAQNLTLPSGDAKIGDTQYTVRTNAMADDASTTLNNIPVKSSTAPTVFLRDVGACPRRLGGAAEHRAHRGRRSVLLSIIKNGNASTLDVVNAVKAALPESRAAAPPGHEDHELFDQSVFVSESIAGVLREGAIAAGADRADDPAVSRLVALDPGRHDLDPAVDPARSIVLFLPRPHHQHHDARRPRARGRHPGRRFDGDDREHAPPAHRGA